MPILPKDRDPRLITIRRGGTLTDEHHRLLAAWALECAEHVLHFFEETRPDDSRPRDALEMGHGWIRGAVGMMDARQAAFAANAAGRGLPDPARLAALSVGQAAAVPTWQPTTSARPPTRSAAPRPPRPPVTRMTLDCASSSGSASGSRPSCASSSWTTSGRGVRSAGTCSTDDLRRSRQARPAIALTRVRAIALNCERRSGFARVNIAKRGQRCPTCPTSTRA